MPGGNTCRARNLSGGQRRLKAETVEAAGGALIEAARNGATAGAFRFPHVPITSRAFPEKTEDEIAGARRFLAEPDDDNTRAILDFACMSVLEEASYTRKDGQYLRWDNRCRRNLRGGMDKGPIPSFTAALRKRLNEILEDIPKLEEIYGGKPPPPAARLGSGETRRHARPFNRPDGQPRRPYANRYDYTRTYALELAWLNFSKADFGELRQALISATVENRSKVNILNWKYPRESTLIQAKTAVSGAGRSARSPGLFESAEVGVEQPARHPLGRKTIASKWPSWSPNPARITKPGGRVVMVNDNVQYHGEEVPVDLILSDIAETCGFDCEEISVLPRGKGNASQQMGRFGRRGIA